MLVDTNVRDLSVDLFGHKLPAPIMFAPIGPSPLFAWVVPLHLYGRTDLENGNRDQ